MRLFALTLKGQYKGLKDQTFTFEQADGNIIAFIGLNGAGKSQLLELIAEAFGYLERYLRSDFKCRGWLDSLALDLKYANQAYDSEEAISEYLVSIDAAGHVSIERDGHRIDLESRSNEGIEEQILPSHIIGYSSGQNENLQRAFMKNAIQYLDVMNVKRSLEQRVTAMNEAQNSKETQMTESSLELFDRQRFEMYRYYQKRNPALFHELPNGTNISDNSDIGLRATALPRLKYFDQDTTALMLASMGMMSDAEQQLIWKDKQRFSKIHSVRLRYDLRKFKYDSGAVLDISKLIKCVGGVASENFSSLAQVDKTPEEFFNQFELDYLAGEIVIDFSNIGVQNSIVDGFSSPQTLFEKLYRLQLLAADFWLGETKRQLRQDGFVGSAKKPQKWRAPIQVILLKLSDASRCIEFDDLSDGEAQLIQILSMAFLYKESRTLFLLDEPETHLNPSWRTYFHGFVQEVIDIANNKAQLFISTHSPFMVSSLRRKNVFKFERNDDGFVVMKGAQNETYGASFDVLIKDLFGLRSLISQSVIDEIRKQLALGDGGAKNWIKSNLDPSAERAYLLKKLK